MTGVICVVTFVTLFLEIGYCQQFEGDLCTHESTRSQGVCKLLDKCQQAKNELVKFQRYPQQCGFEGTQPIVCCIEREERKPGEISYKKCREYSNYTMERIPNPINLIGAPDTLIRNECGHQVLTLIIGGEPAGRKEFPHMALVGFEGSQGIKWLCGGTIISENYILTAAHCLQSQTYGPAKYVRIGITNIESNSIYRQDIEVAQQIAHPSYTPESLYNDIGLLKLKKAAKLNSYSRPACLYSKQQVEVEKVIATGWGKTERGGGSNDLLKVVLKLVDQQSCNSSYRRAMSTRLRYGIVDDSQICYGSANEEEKDTCQGDSGGPLQIYHDNDDIKCMYDIIGVTSFGKIHCGLDAGVYTRVSYFIKWIEDIVWPDNS